MAATADRLERTARVLAGVAGLGVVLWAGYTLHQQDMESDRDRTTIKKHVEANVRRIDRLTAIADEREAEAEDNATLIRHMAERLEEVAVEQKRIRELLEGRNSP